MKGRMALAEQTDSVLNVSKEKLTAPIIRNNRCSVWRVFQDIARRVFRKGFAEYFEDSKAIKCFPQFAELVPGYRRLATELGHRGPVVWLVKAGFTLKRHAPKTGFCREDFDYLQDWDFDDKPTEESLVFWVPRILTESPNKTAGKQLELLQETRRRFKLPENHLASFGSAALNAGLILAEFKRSGNRLLRGQYIHTDTRVSNTYRLVLGRFDEYGLCCGYWRRWGDCRFPYLGCFVLGVESVPV